MSSDADDSVAPLLQGADDDLDDDKEATRWRSINAALEAVDESEPLARRGASDDAASDDRRTAVVLVCTNLTNLCCHSVFSVLASFFPQEAALKGMSQGTVGAVFAAFALASFLVASLTGGAMSRHGQVRIYTCGVALASASTVLFGAAVLLPSGWPFAAWCFSMRILQGVGSALAETATYAIIAGLGGNTTFFLGVSEISTGLGYIVGPALGGHLFTLGGFAAPFVVLGAAVLPAAVIFATFMPPDQRRERRGGEGPADLPLRELLRNPQVALMAVAATLGNSDYAFLEPTLGAHATSLGLATSPETIGALFSVLVVAYTLACPLIGIYAARSRFGPRLVVVTGLCVQLVAFLLVGPSPAVFGSPPSRSGTGTGPAMVMAQMVLALCLFGAGSALSVTPVMDDMMLSCGEAAERAVNSLSSLLASAFSLGQMIGPMLGSHLSSRIGFPHACTLMSCAIGVHLVAIRLGDTLAPRDLGRSNKTATRRTEVQLVLEKAAQDAAHSYTELSRDEQI